MGDRSRIEWTDATWNPVTGCSKVSPGCAHCYAERLSLRYGWSEKPWTAANAAENVKLHPERLDMPLRWRRPRLVFVNSMSDLFHEAVPDEFIATVFQVMGLAQRHTFQVLTKRPERMRRLLNDDEFIEQATYVEGEDESGRSAYGHLRWPLPNVWLGTSVEDQRRAEERIPHLLATPAAVRFLSCEPLLGPVDLSPWLCPGCPDDIPFHVCGRDGLHWVIVGGESGPNARPMHPDWARSLRDQCRAAGVAFFFKQWGEWAPLEVYTDHSAPSALVSWDGRTSTPYCGWGRDVEHRWAHLYRVGRRNAGRLLDGRTWDEMPEPQEVRA